MKLCIECKHFADMRCTLEWTSLVNGDTVRCAAYEARYYECFCGREGRHFEEKRSDLHS